MQQETFTMLEEEIQYEIQRLNEEEMMNDSSKRSKAVQDLAKLIEKMTEAEVANEKWYDNQERREMDKERNRTMAELEEKKQTLDWKRWVLEIAKIGVPVLIPLIFWRKSFKEMLKFEETGRFTSSASKELHLPKIMK